MMSRLWTVVLALSLIIIQTNAMEPYGICQTGCNTVAVACYGAAGVVMGVGSVPACNVALGTCMSACVSAGLLSVAGTVGTAVGVGAASVVSAPVVAAGGVLGGVLYFLFGG